MMCRREREIYKSKVPKTPSRIFFFFAAGDGNSWNSFALFLMNFGDSTKQLELVLCKIYSHSGNPYNKCGGGFHLKTTTTTQQVPNNKQTNKSSILLLFSHTHSLLSHQKEINPPPPRKIRNGSNHKNEKKRDGFLQRQRRPILDLPKISFK
jgi:hypothetical protein